LPVTGQVDGYEVKMMAIAKYFLKAFILLHKVMRCDDRSVGGGTGQSKTT